MTFDKRKACIFFKNPCFEKIFYPEKIEHRNFVIKA